MPFNSTAQGPLRFAGYAALFDVPDAARDVIRHGAFEATLENRAGPVPLLWQHRPEQQIGTVDHIAEDHKGLRVIASIARNASRGARMLRDRKVNGLSFGYRTKSAVHSAAGRELIEIELFEVSLVTDPLQFGARVHFIT